MEEYSLPSSLLYCHVVAVLFALSLCGRCLVDLVCFVVLCCVALALPCCPGAILVFLLLPEMQHVSTDVCLYAPIGSLT